MRLRQNDIKNILLSVLIQKLLKKGRNINYNNMKINEVNTKVDKIKTKKLSKDSEEMEFINIDWLLDHHKTKEQERSQMVNELNLKPGDNVLDLGCGPGLWTPMLAEKVKPNGQVIGIDICHELLEYAKKNLRKSPLKKIIKFQHSDFNNLPFEDNTFDVVFFGNCYAYATDPMQVLEEQKRVTKKGGRIIAKDFDGAIIILHPINPYLSAKILAATARALEEKPPEPFFNNYTGRKLNGLFQKVGIKEVATKSYAIQKLAPLIPEAKRYITGNANWYAKIGTPYLSEKELREWYAHFDPSSDKYILDLDEFYFCMLEVVTEGKL